MLAIPARAGGELGGVAAEQEPRTARLPGDAVLRALLNEGFSRPERFPQRFHRCACAGGDIASESASLPPQLRGCRDPAFRSGGNNHAETPAGFSQSSNRCQSIGGEFVVQQQFAGFRKDGARVPGSAVVGVEEDVAEPGNGKRHGNAEWPVWRVEDHLAAIELRGNRRGAEQQIANVKSRQRVSGNRLSLVVQNPAASRHCCPGNGCGGQSGHPIASRHSVLLCLSSCRRAGALANLSVYATWLDSHQPGTLTLFWVFTGPARRHPECLNTPERVLMCLAGANRTG